MNIQLSKIKLRLPDSGRLLFEFEHLNIPHGSHLLIYGPSGKGKTTLLHLIAGLVIPNDGDVRVGEHNFALLSDADSARLRREHFGVIFQKLNLLEHLTALENVLLGARVESQQALSALETVGMHDKAEQLTVSLSLGEQQRVAVARVLAHQPEIILADEPTSSLDAENASFVMKALKDAARGKTLIVVSHDERIHSYFDDQRNFSELVKA